MAEKLDPRQVVTFGRLVLGLLALAVLGAGCTPLPVGLASKKYRRQTKLDVDIYDLIQSRIAGHMVLATHAAYSRPFGFFARSEPRACELVGDAVTKFLSGEAPSETPGVWVTRMEPTQIESDDTIAVFLDEFGDELEFDYSRGKEKKFVGCITECLSWYGPRGH
jgi:hypothetical protein